MNNVTSLNERVYSNERVGGGDGGGVIEGGIGWEKREKEG